MIIRRRHRELVEAADTPKRGDWVTHPKYGLCVLDVIAFYSDGPRGYLLDHHGDRWPAAFGEFTRAEQPKPKTVIHGTVTVIRRRKRE